jgi:hypothetical protein
MAANDITAAGSSAGDVLVAVTPGNGFVMQWDSDGNGYMGTKTDVRSTTYPCTLKLERSGNTFTGSFSTDGGDTFTEIDSVDIADANVVQDAGLVNAGLDTSRSTVTYSRFTLIDEATVDTTDEQTATFDRKSGDYIIEAAGRDLWVNDDEYGAIYMPDEFDTDAATVTTVESQEYTSDWAKAGVMVANDMTAAGGSAGDVLVAVTPGNGFVMQWDSDGDGYLDTSTDTGSTTYPCTLKLERSGSTFTGYYSTDGGDTFTEIDSVDIGEANDIQDVGLVNSGLGERCRVEYSFFTPSNLRHPPRPTVTRTGTGLEAPFPETEAAIEDYRETLIDESFDRAGHTPEASDPIRISSLQELKEYALRGDVHVKMEPGVYEVTEENFANLATVQGFADGSARPAYTLFVFARENSYYDLRDVTIRFDANAFDDVAQHENNVLFLVYGNNTIIRGLEVDTINKRTGSGSSPWGIEGWTYWGSACDNVLNWDVSITTGGSYPYGVGNLLGKGGGTNSPGGMVKGSGVSSNGEDVYWIDCSVDANHFGHIQTIRSNAVWIDCTFTGETRTTDDILQDKNNAAAAADYERYGSQTKISPGNTIALTEDTYRTYDDYVAQKILGCRVEKSRSGVGVSTAYDSDSQVFVSNTTFDECFKAIKPCDDSTLHDVEADINNGWVLRIRDSTRNVTGDLTIRPSPRHGEDGFVGRGAALIGGADHDLTIRQSATDLQVAEPKPIIVGQHYRADSAANVTLDNHTELPVVLRVDAHDCAITTDGLIQDRGRQNVISSHAETADSYTLSLPDYEGWTVTNGPGTLSGWPGDIALTNKADLEFTVTDTVDFSGERHMKFSYSLDKTLQQVEFNHNFGGDHAERMYIELRDGAGTVLWEQADGGNQYVSLENLSVSDALEFWVYTQDGATTKVNRTDFQRIDNVTLTYDDGSTEYWQTEKVSGWWVENGPGDTTGWPSAPILLHNQETLEFHAQDGADYSDERHMRFRTVFDGTVTSLEFEHSFLGHPERMYLELRDRAGTVLWEQSGSGDGTIEFEEFVSVDGLSITDAELQLWVYTKSGATTDVPEGHYHRIDHLRMHFDDGTTKHCESLKIAEDGLEAHYELESDTPVDSSGNGNDATVVGDPDTGQPEGAYTLDGVDDALDIPSFAPRGDSVTIACWVRLDALGPSSDTGTQFALWGDDSPQFELAYRRRSSGDGLEFYYDDGSTLHGITEEGIAVDTDRWMHVAGTYDDRTGEWRVYIDGTRYNPVVADPIDASHSGTQSMAGDHPSQDRALDGRMESLVFYDRALSGDEIASLAAEPRDRIRTGTFPTHRLRAYYPLGSDTPVDATSFDNDATIVGDPLTNAPGVGDRSYRFDGTYDALTLPEFAPSGGSVSITCRVNLDDYGPGGDGEGTQFAFWGDAPPNFALHYNRRSSGDGLEFRYYDGSQNHGIYKTEIDPELDTWVDIAGVYDDATGEWSLYLNGIEVASAQESITHSFTGSNNMVGGHPNLDRKLDGHIDEVRLFDRALSLSEIQNIAGEPF